MVNAGYFRALGITLLKGRGFDEHDSDRSQPVCVVNEEFVRRHLRGREPLGTVVKIPKVAFAASGAVERQIVGVIRQVASQHGEVEKPVELYVPIEQNAWYNASIALKTDGDPLRLSTEARAAIARVDPDLPVLRLRTMDQAASAAVVRPRFRARIVLAFASVALLLASVGIFSVLMFSVRQRAREIGIRIAVGADSRRILALVLRAGGQVTAAGLAIGLALAAVLTRSLQSILYGVTPIDLMTYAGSILVLATAAFLACLAPAAAAVRTDPAVMLRRD
jgi:putative ABC transport system permease protein